MHSQIALRKIAAAASNLVNLPVWFVFSRNTGYTCHVRPNPAAIRFRADGFDLDPVISGAGIAAQ